MTSTWPELLTKVAARTDLSRDETAAAMTEVLQGEADPSALAALLMGLKMKGEAVPEILGFADAMLAASEPLELPEGTIDIVGSGGSDHRRTHALNVSSMATFVAAAAGATVCKHGNVAASSTSGSFDFLAALGVDIHVTPARVAEQVAQSGLGFVWSRTFHPAMRHAGPVRTALGVPTVFNMLGPLVHPGRVRRMLLGASSDIRAEQSAQVLSDRNIARAWVVAGHGGLDEISTTGPNRVLEVTSAGVKEFTLHPEAVGISLVEMGDIAGGDAAANVKIFRSMIDGAIDSPAADIVVLNAAAGLVVGGVADDLISAVAAARESLSSGRVAQFVEDFTRPD